MKAEGLTFPKQFIFFRNLTLLPIVLYSHTFALIKSEKKGLTSICNFLLQKCLKIACMIILNIQGGSEKCATPVICNFNNVVDKMLLVFYFTG